jgi:phosphatidate cytidylyltransferase
LTGAARRANAPARAFSDLGPRLISGVVLGGVAMAALALGGAWTAALVALAAAAMTWEWRAMAVSDPTRIRALGAVLAVTPAFIAYMMGIEAALAAVLIVSAILGLRDLVVGQNVIWGWVGCVYIGIACAAFVVLRDSDPFGFHVALWIALVVMGADIGGYFAGRLIGGPKLWPQVSPKKTWAGLAGGVALAFALGGLFSWMTTGTYAEEVCTVSAIAALVAQAGDLAESSLKRKFGVKDSSGLIPGHGGALDRLDGFLAATLVVAVVSFGRTDPIFVW